MPTPVKHSPKKVKKGVATAGKPATTLDQDEVMRSMMAARKAGKQRDTSPETSGTEDDEESSDEASSQEVRKEGAEDTDVTSNSASAESSTSRVDTRGAKRSRSSSPASSSSPKPEPNIPRGVNTTTSRVNLPSRTTKASSPPKQAQKPPSTTTFTSLGLSQTLISSLESINIRKPTEIQAACVGPIMSGK